MASDDYKAIIIIIMQGGQVHASQERTPQFLEKPDSWLLEFKRDDGNNMGGGRQLTTILQLNKNTSALT